MSSTSKAWAAATSIGAVEALKDQLGFCRWNYVIRSAQQYARNNVRGFSQAPSKLSSNSPAAVVVCGRLKEAGKARQSEEESHVVELLGP